MPCKRILFTDIDGTLIDHDTYEPGPTREAVRRVQEDGIPIVFCSARTRVEQEWLRRDLRVRDPFIVENGGVIFVPWGYFSRSSASAEAGRGGAVSNGDDLYMIPFGIPYDTVRRRLHQAAALAGLRVRGYGDMSVEEVARVTGLDLEAAARAKAREFDESFLIVEDLLEGDSRLVDNLRTELARYGMTLSRGTRLWAAMGAHDKGRAVRDLTVLFRERFGPVKTYAIGDYLNDVPMLEAVDVPVLLQRPGGRWADVDVANLTRVSGVGPEGWCRAVEGLFEL